MSPTIAAPWCATVPMVAVLDFFTYTQHANINNASGIGPCVGGFFPHFVSHARIHVLAIGAAKRVVNTPVAIATTSVFDLYNTPRYAAYCATPS